MTNEIEYSKLKQEELYKYNIRIAYYCIYNEFSKGLPRNFSSRGVCGFLSHRLAARTASRVVSLYLDGDVSFLPDNSFPAQLQLLKVSVLILHVVNVDSVQSLRG